ncbi:MAG: hypothetical protein AAB320_06580 [Elusimicrobiota bacterium]
MSIKKTLFAVIIAAPLCASAQEKAPPLPDSEQFKAALSEAAAPAAVVGKAVGIAQASVPPLACPVPSLDGAEIKGRWFSSTMDVRWKTGEDMGTIETSGRNGRVFRDTRGNIVADASVAVNGDWRTITVKGCNGEVVGTIVENDAPYGGNRAFTLKDASGAVLGSAQVEYMQDVFSITGPGGAVATVNGKRIFASGADGRLVAMLSVYNDSADMRESAERRRERQHDRPGRGDR